MLPAKAEKMLAYITEHITEDGFATIDDDFMSDDDTIDACRTLKKSGKIRDFECSDCRVEFVRLK